MARTRAATDWQVQRCYLQTRTLYIIGQRPNAGSSSRTERKAKTCKAITSSHEVAPEAAEQRRSTTTARDKPSASDACPDSEATSGGSRAISSGVQC